MTSGGNVSISTSEPKFGSGKLQFGGTPTRDGFVKSQTYSTLATIDHLRFRFLPWWRPTAVFCNYDSSIYTPMVFARGGYLLVGNATLNGWTFVPAVMIIGQTAYQHCAVVGDGTNIKVYRDGSLISSTPHPNWASASWLIQLGKDGYSAIQMVEWMNFCYMTVFCGLLIYTT